MLSKLDGQQVFWILIIAIMMTGLTTMAVAASIRDAVTGRYGDDRTEDGDEDEVHDT